MVIFNQPHVSTPQTNPRLFPCSPSLHFHINPHSPTFPNATVCLHFVTHLPSLTNTTPCSFFFFFTRLRCVKKWRPSPVERQRLSFLHMLREALLETLRRSRSFGDLASLRPRPKSSLEVYVSVLCPPPNPSHLASGVQSPLLGCGSSRGSRRPHMGALSCRTPHVFAWCRCMTSTNWCVFLVGLKLLSFFLG